MPEMELVDSVPAPAPAVEATPSPAPEIVPEPVAETLTDPTPEEPVATPAATQLYKLPDGREVDAAGLQKEYENLLPEFTRKSQELAALKTQNPPITKEEPAWKNPEFQPTSWAEAIEIAKQEAISEMTKGAEAEAAAEAALRSAVEGQLAEIKVSDPSLDENALFEHAVKYGFNDLKTAHSNFKAFKNVVVSTEQRVLKDVQTRAADPIATTPAPAPVAPKAEYAPAPGQFRGALDFLESLKANKN